MAVFKVEIHESKDTVHVWVTDDVYPNKSIICDDFTHDSATRSVQIIRHESGTAYIIAEYVGFPYTVKRLREGVDY